MKTLTKEEVIHIAKLANLELSEEELVKFQKQLSEILTLVEKNIEVKTEKVVPLFNVTAQKNVSREDEKKPSLTATQALANTTSKYDNFFRVKAVLED